MKKALTLFLSLCFLLCTFVSCADPANSLPSGSETTTGERNSGGTTIEPAKTDRSPWYLSAKQPALTAPSISEADSDYVIKVPLSTVATVGSVDILLELFQDVWSLGEWMQCRITLTNTGREEFVWYARAQRLLSVENDTGSMDNVQFLSSVKEIETIAPGTSKTVEFLLPLSPEKMSIRDAVEGVIRIATSDTNAETVFFPVTAGKTVKTPEAWYIDAWELDMIPPIYGSPADDATPIIPIDKENLSFDAPEIYEATQNGISVRMEVYGDSFRVGDFMQVKFTLLNEGDTDFTFRTDAGYASPMTVRHPSRAGANASHAPIVHMWPSNSRETGEFLWELATNLTVDAICEFTLPKGESIVLENLYYISPDFYDVAGDYTLDLSLTAIIDPNWDYGGTVPTLTGEVDFGSVTVCVKEIAE